MEIVNIPINRIDIQDEKFDISYAPDISNLILSIKEFGVVDPVLLLDVSENKMKLISGFLRTRASQKLGLIEIPAVIISSLDATSKQLFIHRLVQNFPHRIYNDIEKSIILNKAINEFNFSEIEFKEDISFLINLDKNQNLNNLKEIFKYDNKIKDYILNQKITLKTAQKLHYLSNQDSEKILDIFDKILPSSSNQRFILDCIEEITSRKRLSIHEFLNSDDLNNIDIEKNTASQKCNKFISILKKFRFPLYTEAEKNFKKQKAKIKLPGSIQIEHSEFFEKPGLGIKFWGETLDDFNYKVKTLSEVIEKDEFSELFFIEEKLMEGIDQ